MDIKSLQVLQEPDKEGLAKIRVTCWNNDRESFWLTDCKLSNRSDGRIIFTGTVDNDLTMTGNHGISLGQKVQISLSKY